MIAAEPAADIAHPSAAGAGRGSVLAVRGSVVDVRFEDALPAIHSILHAGPNGDMVVEVQAHRDAHSVRCIGLTPTQGLARGMHVEDTGAPLMAPVGNGVLSRMFDVFGHAIDRLPAPIGLAWRSVHRAPPSLLDRSSASAMFETGIKLIDVLVPL